MKHYLPLLLILIALSSIPAIGQPNDPPLPGPNASLTEIQKWIATAMQDRGDLRTNDIGLNFAEVRFDGCKINYHVGINRYHYVPRSAGSANATSLGITFKNNMVPVSVEKYWFTFDLADLDPASIVLLPSEHDQEKMYSLQLTTRNMKLAITHSNTKEKDLKSNKPTLNRVKLEIDKEIGFDFRGMFVRAAKLCSAS